MNEYAGTPIAIEEPDNVPFDEPDEDYQDTVNDKIRLLDKYVEMINIADEVDADELVEIGMRVVEEYDIDENSRKEWKEQYKDAMELAKLLSTPKNEPWPGAANVKYPLIAQASLAFSSRALPAILDGVNIVKGRVIGDDPEGLKAARALRIGEHMSFQCNEEMDGWIEGMDRLLVYLPVIGTAFKKTWRNHIDDRNESEFYGADEIVVNNNVRKTRHISRMTHIYDLFPNEITERENDQVFLEIEYGNPDPDGEVTKDPQDDDAPHTFLEQHRWWDLDDDGYKEPYIVTVHKDSKQVVRITAMYDAEDIKYDENNRVIKIKPVEYFTKFTFIPSFDGSFYDIGFGIFLGPLNKTINSTLNQMLDAGSAQNNGGGLFSQSLSLGKGGTDGTVAVKMNEFKGVNYRGDDIRKAFMPFDHPGPSGTLYNLLALLIDASKEFASSTDLMAGESPSQNTPATTTIALLEQGMKVFNAIFKRIHRSLKSEFKKLYRLNRLYLDDEAYYIISDNRKAIARVDYDGGDCDVVPASDPNNTTNAERLMKADALYEKVGTGFNDEEIRKYWLESLQIPDKERFLIKKEDIPPDPKLEIEMRKLDLEERKFGLEERKFEVEERKTNTEMLKIRADAIRAIADAEAKEAGTQIDKYKAEVEELKIETEQQEKEKKPGNENNKA